jgi:hypothetical protein
MYQKKIKTCRNSNWKVVVVRKVKAPKNIKIISSEVCKKILKFVTAEVEDEVVYNKKNVWILQV